MTDKQAGSARFDLLTVVALQRTLEHVELMSLIERTIP